MKANKKLILTCVLGSVFCLSTAMLCQNLKGEETFINGIYNGAFVTYADETVEGVIGDTMYMTSNSKDYLLMATALHMDDVSQYSEIGYEIKEVGDDEYTKYGSDAYYTGITVKLSNGGTKTWTMPEIFGAETTAMGMIVYEMPYDQASAYSIKPYAIANGEDAPVYGEEDAVKTVQAIEVDASNAVLDFAEGTEFATDGLVVIATYSDGSKGAITDYNVSGYDENKTGRQTITVEKDGYSATYDIHVRASFSTIGGGYYMQFEDFDWKECDIDTRNDFVKTYGLEEGQYYVNKDGSVSGAEMGSTYASKFYLGTRARVGFAVRLGYDNKTVDNATDVVVEIDGVAQTCTSYPITTDHYSSRFVVPMFGVVLDKGFHTISYKTTTKTFTSLDFLALSLGNPDMTGIEIDTTNAKKDFYGSEAFSYDGLVVKATFAEGESVTVPVNHALVDCTLPSATGKSTATVYAYGYIATYEVAKHASVTAVGTTIYEAETLDASNVVFASGWDHVAIETPTNGASHATYPTSGGKSLGAFGPGSVFTVKFKLEDKATVALFNRISFVFGGDASKMINATLNGEALATSGTVPAGNQSASEYWQWVDAKTGGVMNLEAGEYTLVINVTKSFNYDCIKIETLSYGEYVSEVTLDVANVMKTFVVGSTLDFSNLVVKVGDYTVSENVYTVVAPDLTTTGEKQVVVNVGDASAQYTINVIDAKQTGIEVDASGADVEYLDHEDFSANGIVVYEVYENGAKVATNDYTVTPADTCTAGVKDVIVTSGEFSTTYQVTVTLATAHVLSTTATTELNFYTTAAKRDKTYVNSRCDVVSRKDFVNAGWAEGAIPGDGGNKIFGFVSAVVRFNITVDAPCTYTVQVKADAGKNTTSYGLCGAQTTGSWAPTSAAGTVTLGTMEIAQAGTYTFEITINGGDFYSVIFVPQA